MSVKIASFSLIYKEDYNELNYDDLYNVLIQLQNESAKIANRAVQIYWENSNYCRQVKSMTGRFPTKDELLKHYGCSEQNYVYRLLTKEFYKNSTGNISTIIQFVGKRYKRYYPDYLSGKRSIESYKSSFPIYLCKNNIRVFKEDGKYYIKPGLISALYKSELSIHSGSVIFELGFGKSSSYKTLLDNIINQLFSLTSSKIIFLKKKIIIQLGYNTNSNIILDNSSCRVMGIDIGVAKPFVYAFNDITDFNFVDGNEIKNFQKQMLSRRQSLGRQTKNCADSKIGHGIHKRIEGIEKLGQKESNFRNRINHQYSRMIVDAAIKYKCTTIQIEDLSGISSENKFLKSWPYYDLQSKIEYKAKECGIDVVKINPKFTSQRCSKCGYISKENRKTQAGFKCKNCGFEENADLNAARNIAIPKIDSIIQESLRATT